MGIVGYQLGYLFWILNADNAGEIGISKDTWFRYHNGSTTRMQDGQGCAPEVQLVQGLPAREDTGECGGAVVADGVVAAR
jgi:hypothetical protein